MTREEEVRRDWQVEIEAARAAADRELLEEVGGAAEVAGPMRGLAARSMGGLEIARREIAGRGIAGREIAGREIGEMNFADALTADVGETTAPGPLRTRDRRTLKKTALILREATIFDQQRPAEERVAAIGKSFGAPMPKRFILRLIALLGEPTENLDVRAAVLDALKGAAFSSPTYSAWRPAFLRALRKVTTEEASPLVTRAYETLAQEKDGQALAELEEGLRDPERAKLSKLDAVHLLTYDDHGEHFDIFRELAAGDGEIEVREEATGALAADPAARDLLVQLLQDTGEPASIRQAALFALRVLNPDDYSRFSLELLQNPAEDEEVQTAAITALRIDSDAVGRGPRVGETVEELSRSTESGMVRTAANLYLGKE